MAHMHLLQNPKSIFWSATSKNFAESRTRGHCYKLIKPRCETSFRLRSFSQRVITDWNSLPYDVVTAQTLNSVKNRVDKFWSGGDMYNF